jgi:hypothetical protein
MSAWAVLVGLVDRPGDALTNITAYPRWRWVLPVMLTVAALALSLALTAPLLTIQTRQMLAEQMAQLPAEQASVMQEQLQRFEKPEAVASTAFATALAGQLIGWVALSVTIYFGVLIAGGELEFRRILGAAPWLTLPFAAEWLLQAIFAQAAGRLIINQGLSYLASVGKPAEDMRNLAYSALGQLTLFRLWHWLLVYALLRKAAKLSDGTALVLTVVNAALAVGMRLALAALTGRLNPG